MICYYIIILPYLIWFDIAGNLLITIREAQFVFTIDEKEVDFEVIGYL